MIEIRGGGGVDSVPSPSTGETSSNFLIFLIFQPSVYKYIYIYAPISHALTNYPFREQFKRYLSVSLAHSLSLSFSTVVIASPLRVFTDRYSSIYKSFYSRTVRQTTGNYRFQVDGSPAVFMRPLDPPARSNNGRQNLVRLVISPARYARKITITRCVFSELPAFISKKKCPRHNNNKRRGGRRGHRPILAEGKKKNRSFW